MASLGIVRQLKGFVRNVLVAIGMILLIPLWLPVRFERCIGRDSFFAGCSEFLSLVPGRIGIYLRRSFYTMTLDGCATDVHVGFGTTLAHPQVRIGRGVYIGNRCTVGMCELEDHVTIGSNVDLLSGRRQHHFVDAHRPLQQQGGQFTRIHLRRNCWIGNSSIVMANVGPSAIVGAGAVVVQSVATATTVVGNPAQILRRRAAG